MTSLTEIKQYFDSIALQRKKWLNKGKFFHQEDLRVFKDLIPEGSNVLELGCGNGHLLNGLKPKIGIGIDISKNLIQEGKKDYPNLELISGNAENAAKLVDSNVNLDYIIICDSIGYIKDIQNLFGEIQKLTKPHTRLIITYFSPLWVPFLSIATFLKLKMKIPNTSLLYPADIKNFLKISNFDTVRTEKKILFPYKFFGLGRLINRFIAVVPLISNLCLRHYVIARSLKSSKNNVPKSASIIIPCKNEEKNIKLAISRIPKFTNDIEVIFVEGNSKDRTWNEIQKVIKDNKTKKKFSVKGFKQKGKGKADAVFLGFEKAKNDVLIILDADLTVAPEDLGKFWEKIFSGDAEFVNGTRLVYPMDDDAMRYLNHIANRGFSLLFTWLLGQRYTDTLCGTKVIKKNDFFKIKKQIPDFEDFDPFGDFYLIFGSQKLCLKMVEIPIRYKARIHGETQISRFTHGLLLIKMLLVAFFRIKAI